MTAELHDLLSAPSLEWAPRFTALFLLAVRPWRQHEPAGSFAYLLGKIYLVSLMTALLLPKVAGAPSFWFFLTLVHFSWIYLAYAVADNHRYLEGYWCLSMALALMAGDPEGARYLALDARLLIGLCFLLAVLWKVWSRNYREGGFFVDRLFFERRFLPIASGAAGLTPDIQIKHMEARRKLVGGETTTAQAPVPKRLRCVAWTMAWWTVAIESLVAILFLLPLPHLDLWRTVALGVFVITTYLLVPVPSFGQILLLMALVAVEDVELRIFLLALALAVAVFAGIAHLLGKMARRRMRRLQKKSRIPKISWTARAAQRRLEQEGNSWRLVFPSVPLSLYVKSGWIPQFQDLLASDQGFPAGELFSSVPETEQSDLKELLSILLTLKLISHSRR